jgi:hypothetical protein
MPKHMTGGIYDNSPDNITPPISVELHAALHKDLWRHLGKWQDELAYKSLLELSLSGFEFTPEIRKKISDGLKGKKRKPFTKEHLSHLSKSHKGQIPSNIEFIRNYNKGKKFSEEHKQHIAIANTGKHQTKESNEKNRQAHLGKKPSEETKLKISESNKGKHSITHSKETRKKMSESHKGKIPWNKGKKNIIMVKI